MAHRIKAINTYRPRIEQGNTVQKPELLRSASRATGLVEGTLDQSIKEMRDQLASIAKTLGIKEYDPVPGWQTVYFGSSHLVTKEKALSCANCHAPNGALNFKSLGYTDEEIRKLTSAALYFDKMAAKQKEDW